MVRTISLFRGPWMILSAYYFFFIVSLCYLNDFVLTHKGIVLHTHVLHNFFPSRSFFQITLNLSKVKYTPPYLKGDSPDCHLPRICTVNKIATLSKWLLRALPKQLLSKANNQSPARELRYAS